MSLDTPDGGTRQGHAEGLGQPASSQTIRAVTIAQLHRAIQVQFDGEWRLGENILAQIKLVAEARDHRVRNTHRSFLLDDGTAVLNGKLWVDTEPSALEEPFRGVPISQPAYFRLTGSLRAHGGKRYLQIANMRRVTDMNEVYYHLLETIYVHVVLQKGLPSTINAVQSPVQKPLTRRSPVPVDAKPNLFSPLADRIVNYLSTVSDSSGEGVAVGVISRALACDAIELSETVERMFEEGIIYSTVNDSYIRLAV